MIARGGPPAMDGTGVHTQHAQPYDFERSRREVAGAVTSAHRLALPSVSSMMKPTDGALDSCAQHPVMAAARLVCCRTSAEGAFWTAAPTWLEAALASAVCAPVMRLSRRRKVASA